MSGSLVRGLSMTTALGVYSWGNSAFAHSAAANHYKGAFPFHHCWGGRGKFA